jgi:hypothetical protein
MKKIFILPSLLLGGLMMYQMFVPTSFDARGLLYGVWQKSGDSIYYTGDKVQINTDFT